ncbi:Alpha/Beta hydrolase protein [Mycena galericulata]|nr:Alpha/Beta hydrolase protein [Mycena galericulata]
MLFSQILVVAATFGAAFAVSNSFNVKPFKIDLANEIPRLNALVNNTRLPAKALYPVGPDKGIEFDFLRELQSQWLDGYDWETQQAELNQFNHYTTDIEGQIVHFIHEKSTDPDAIPILLLHGWPGSFFEFSPFHGKERVINVVVPSLPGFVFSSVPPLNWTTDDTARIYNTLMTEVLGYSMYAVHGTDWVCMFNGRLTPLTHSHIHFTGPSTLLCERLNLTSTEQRNIDWTSQGMSYLLEQTQKPNDIGLALYDSPVGQLAWMGSKFQLWSDPRAGTPPSVLNTTAILTSVSLYYLTDSFLSAAWIYAQNPTGFRTVYSKAATDAPLLFSQYEYNIFLWPQEYVALVGNLVSYKIHDFGGHFAGLDNPPALIEDIREMGLYFKA